MNTIILRVDPDNINTEEAVKDIQKAGQIVKDGGLVGFPTETVYGLGGDALNPESSRKIYAAKGRPSDNPLIVHVEKAEDVPYITKSIPPKGAKLMEVFWPGPLTIVYDKSEVVPYETTGGLDTVAVRNPSNETARMLIREGGGYIAAPSANLSGHPSPTTAQHVIHDLAGRIDVIIDGGSAECGLESTIVDVTVDPPMILRPGFITREMMEAVVGEVVIDKAIIAPDSGIKPKAPGMKYRHYAPKAEMIIVEGDPDNVREKIQSLASADMAAGLKVGIITMETGVYKADCVIFIGERTDPAAVGSGLYGALRDMDEANVDRIYSEALEETGVGAAVMNRLMKAAGHTVITV